MQPQGRQQLNAHLACHHGVVTAEEAHRLGLTGSQIQYRLRTGEWRTVHRGVYAAGGMGLSPEGAISAACSAAGPSAVASHRSAAWLWGLLETPPAVPTVTVPATVRRRISGVVTYRSGQRPPATRRREIPATTAPRTILDLAAVASDRELDHAVDVALARRYVRVDQLQRLASPRRGSRRLGALALRRALRRRGFLGAPTPSVLESRTSRLLRRWKIEPLAADVPILGNRYRADYKLAPAVLLEVDGYAYHSSPEAKAADSRRRNALRSAGYTIIEADWITVVHHPEQLRAEIERVLGRRLPGGRGPAPGRRRPPPPIVTGRCSGS
jgi:very-short-patch-repair endonuclease